MCVKYDFVALKAVMISWSKFESDAGRKAGHQEMPGDQMHEAIIRVCMACCMGERKRHMHISQHTYTLGASGRAGQDYF